MGNLKRKRGADEAVETGFRKRLREGREGHRWTQAHMARLLCDKGITAYATTVAKIEAGERAVRAEELVAIAELFEVSVDTLLGRTHSGQVKDQEFLVSALKNAAISTALQVQSVGATLQQAVADLDSFDLAGREKTLYDGCQRACTVLDDAVTAISDTWVQDEQLHYWLGDKTK